MEFNPTRAHELIEILRQESQISGFGSTMSHAADQLAACMEELDTARKLLARYRHETPLGHQPHMIAHLADKALGRE